MNKTVSSIAILSLSAFTTAIASETAPAPESAAPAPESPAAEATQAQSPSINDFVGEWSVNLDQTRAEAESNAAQLPKLIESQIGDMKLRVSERELVYIQGEQEIALPFSVTGAIDNKVTIVSKQEDKEENLTLALVDEEFLNLQSDTKADYNFYIWQKAF